MLTDYVQRFKKSDGTFNIFQTIHIDLPLFIAIILLLSFGLLILYSATSESFVMVRQQAARIGFSLMVMIILAQISPQTYQRWAPVLYGICLILLVITLFAGHVGKGGQRWINMGIIRIQPSEMMKLALPMFLAWYCHRIHLPLSARSTLMSGLIILVPAALTAKQPDLTTASLLVAGGGFVLLLAGLSWRLIGTLLTIAVLSAPVLWYSMYDYQRQRIFTFLNPEHDPLGAGYHIIQSKIAIGSGGLFGKGWLNGTQSNLHFLPEHHTDFIFAVCCEEFGFIGSIILLSLFIIIIARGLYITLRAQDTFSRLLAGSLTFTFFIFFFTNMGMVTGILPVAGLPLPLVSYGGSSMVTLMASFGILMSIQTHRKLLTM